MGHDLGKDGGQKGRPGYRVAKIALQSIHVNNMQAGAVLPALCLRPTWRLICGAWPGAGKSGGRQKKSCVLLLALITIAHQFIPPRRSAVVSRMSILNSIKVGRRSARAAVVVGLLPLPSHLRLLPYPGSEPVGHALIKETGV